MSQLFKKFFLFSLCLILFVFLSRHSLAITKEECEGKIGKEELNEEELKECEQILVEAIGKEEVQERTLESEVERFDNKISLTMTKIVQTEEQIKILEREIEDLAEKLGLLDLTLNKISTLLIKRIEQTYKKGRVDSLLLLFSSQSFSEFISRYEYFKAVQLHDRKLLFQMEEARVNYQQQKEIKEEKQNKLEQARQNLETEKDLLGQQKQDKERFLSETRGNKAYYQQLLQITQAEIEAIQRIIAGEGDCAEAGGVNQGERIAAIISGSSACSLGTHLHFEVRENDEVKNPFSYLKNIDLVDDSDGDPHLATGDWDWPLAEPIRLTQGFGADTAAIRAHTVWYDFHTGIDVVSKDLVVKAVKPGTLSRCSISCGGGTLRYVVVDHQDSDFNTYYLHVNY